MKIWQIGLIIAGIGTAIAIGVMAFMRASKQSSPQTGLIIKNHALAYENKEEWEVVRGPDKRITKVIIHRSVVENG